MESHSKVKWVLNSQQNPLPTEIHLPARGCYFTSNSFFFFFYSSVYSSVVHLPAVLIPLLESTVFFFFWSVLLTDPKNMIVLRRQLLISCLSHIHCLSLSQPSPSPPSLCWQKPILDGVSFCVMYLSHQRERLFFTYPTRPSQRQIYCQCWGWSWLPPLCDVFSLMRWHSWVKRWAFTIDEKHFGWCREKESGEHEFFCNS